MNKKSSKVRSVQQARSYFIKALLASLLATGIIGIWVLLAGTFGEVEGKILLSTFLFGGYSVLSLCCLAIADRPYGLLAVAGIMLSSIALVIGLVLVWLLGNIDFEGIGNFFKAYFVFEVAAVAVAHASLVLLLSGKKPNVAVLGTTLGCISIVALMIIFPVLTSFDDLSDVYWRLLGVFAIVDVIGTIISATLAKLKH
jgi:uncharacterized Tic20 family protein